MGPLVGEPQPVDCLVHAQEPADLDPTEFFLADVNLAKRADEPRQFRRQRDARMRVQELHPSASDGQLETDSLGEVRRPCSGAVDDYVGAECPLGHQNTPDPISFEVEPHYSTPHSIVAPAAWAARANPCTTRCWFT